MCSNVKCCMIEHNNTIGYLRRVVCRVLGQILRRVLGSGAPLGTLPGTPTVLGWGHS